MLQLSDDADRRQQFDEFIVKLAAREAERAERRRKEEDRGGSGSDDDKKEKKKKHKKEKKRWGGCSGLVGAPGCALHVIVAGVCEGALIRALSRLC